MAPARYRKKPVVIEAVQFTGDNVDEITTFLGGGSDWNVSTYDVIVIETLEGDMEASVGDYIIRGIQGEFYPCKPTIFAASYEPADT